jgi:hypothetical protein
VTIGVGASHGFLEGERIEIKGLEAIRREWSGGATEDVIPKDELNRVQEITAVGATTVSFEVATTVPTDRDTSDGATEGGTGGTWNAIDKYKASHSGMPNATSTVIAGGGSAPIAWSLHSLAPDVTRKVALTNIPKFNFRDALSPPPSNEIQRLIFDQFATGDRFRLEIEGERGDKLDYAADQNENALQIQEYLNNVADRTGIRVEFDLPGSEAATDSAGHTVHYYIVTFDGDTAQRNWNPINAQITNSENGLFTNENVAQGGSTAEDVWSDTRGWPRTVAFHQRRLWFAASDSRPLTVWASVPEDFYNFDTGDFQPSDAIDNTGQYDPIRFIRVASTGLHLVTTGSVVDITPDRDTGGFQHPLNFNVGESYGGAQVSPVVLAGLVHYVDTIERSIRQMRFNDADRLASFEVSQAAQSLIVSPDRLATLRNEDGDFLFVVNSDGTIAVMTLDIPQEVLAWAKWETDAGGGGYVNACQAGGYLYTVASRTAGLILEKFDPARTTDAGVLGTGSDQTSWSGLTHLNGVLCDVRGDEATLDQATPSGGSITSKSGGIEYACDECEVGIPITWRVDPTPVVTASRTRMLGGELDFIASRLEGVRVDGYPIFSREYNSTTTPPPEVTGMVRFRTRGWKQRAAVSITGSGPQPVTIRAAMLEAA